MKKFYIGYYNRIDLNNAIKKTLGIPNLILVVGVLLFVLIPVLLRDKIIPVQTDMSNVVLVKTDFGTGSAVYVGNGNSYLITAAHVVSDMEVGGVCSIEFQDPNDMDNKIYAQANLLYKGNWNQNILSVEYWKEDYALLAVVNLNVKNYSDPCQIATNLSSVKVSDKISVEGYPNGVYSKNEGTINNVNGGFLKDKDFFIVDAGVWPGNSGGALLDVNKQLLGIVTNRGPASSDFNGQVIVLKIDYVLKELAKHGFVIN